MCLWFLSLRIANMIEAKQKKERRMDIHHLVLILFVHPSLYIDKYGSVMFFPTPHFRRKLYFKTYALQLL